MVSVGEQEAGRRGQKSPGDLKRSMRKVRQEPGECGNRMYLEKGWSAEHPRTEMSHRKDPGWHKNLLAYLAFAHLWCQRMLHP